MTLIPENTTRKIDSLGRITLPKGLRDRMMISENDEIELYTAHIDGKHCVCLAKPKTEEEEINEAIALLNKYGIKVKREDD